MKSDSIELEKGSIDPSILMCKEAEGLLFFIETID